MPAESSMPPGPQADFLFEDTADVKIASHVVDYDEHLVEFWVEWRDTPNTRRRTSKYDEIHIQDVRTEMVYTYWAGLGDRCTVTQFCVYHVYGILDEQ
ncbi:hypothetical protein ACHAPU_008074 [Fusarium lateritium]